jgi:hypothetical protein
VTLPGRADDLRGNPEREGRTIFAVDRPVRRQCSFPGVEQRPEDRCRAALDVAQELLDPFAVEVGDRGDLADIRWEVVLEVVDVPGADEPLVAALLGEAP